MMRVAINGFGRIGRSFLRGVLLNPQALEKYTIAAINIGPAKLDFVAHMFKYDTLMGTFALPVHMENDELVVGQHRIKILTEADPAKLPWAQLGIDWVVDCSGRFTSREGASKHVQAGAGHVLISAPAKDEDVTIVPGVNDAAFDAQVHKIVSLGSCTTNAFATTLKVLQDTFIIERGTMTTVHAYTNSQVLLDVEGKDLRSSRAAALNIIPTSTGAMKVLGKVIPALQGKIEAMSLRVPIAKVSLLDITVITQKPLTVQAINNAFEQAAKSELKNILSITYEPLVSSDFSGNSNSVIIDGLLTATSGQHMGKVFGWYDNEWGYSMRLRDFLINVA